MSLKELLLQRDPGFKSALVDETLQVKTFSQALTLNTLRRKALLTDVISRTPEAIRLAIVGGCSLRPLSDLVEHFTEVFADSSVDLWLGDFDNYMSEVIDPSSDLYGFSPNIVVLVPSELRCRYLGEITDPFDTQLASAEKAADEILNLCKTINVNSGAEVILVNFKLPPGRDPGPIRNSNLAVDYSFRKAVNMAIGKNLRSFIHLCDAEFIANRIGTELACDNRAWFESKLPGSKEFIFEVAKEIGFLVHSMRSPAKKVVVLDLDNTLWGGVVGDDGLEGIELGTTSARGEAFRHFQQYLLSLSKRGILLAVCSKNNYETGIKPFIEHPEMILRSEDIVSFKINWNPKSDNIREIATELNLGLNSFVFLDDNIAEIEIVRQFAPEVTGIWLGDDPSTFSAKVQDSRLFETKNITTNDLDRTRQYQAEKIRKDLQSTAADMPTYLNSLEMVGQIKDFDESDVPRISQLINKSNQFNLTTIRRSEAEVEQVIADPNQIGMTVRLSDRFGDHGLIGILILEVQDELLRIETWIMSCRVLKRQVEDFMMNEVFDVATARGCKVVEGRFAPTAKNAMVANHYPSFGFETTISNEIESLFQLALSRYSARQTKIRRG